MNFNVKLITKTKSLLPIEITITNEDLIWRAPKANDRSRTGQSTPEIIKVPASDILAVHHVTSGFKHQENTDLRQIYYIEHKPQKILKMTSLTIAAGKEELEVCTRKLKSVIKGNKMPKRLLVFVNPISGKKMGVQIYRKHMAPLFKICGIHADVIVTNRRHHVTDVIDGYDLASIDGIVTVGGDGLYSECVNALLSRRDLTTASQYSEELSSIIHPDNGNGNPTPRVSDSVTASHQSQTSELKIDLPVGIIPAGSGNVLVNYLHGNKDIGTSILHIIKGQTTRSNVAAIYQDQKPPLFSTLILGFGLCGEMVRDCEKTRRFGPPRYSVAPLNSLFKRRTIMMAVEVTSAEADEQHDQHKPRNNNKTYVGYLEDKIYSIDMWVPTLVNGSTAILPVFGDNNICLHAVRKCSLLNHLRHLCKVNSRKTQCFDFDFISSMRGTGYKVTLKENGDHLSRKFYINNDGDPVLLQSIYFDVRLFKDAVLMYGSV